MKVVLPSESVPQAVTRGMQAFGSAGSQVQYRTPRLFISLEWGRLVAALVVSMFHASAIIGLFHGREPFDDVVRAGHIGVEFFFILSGFLIFLIHQRDIGRHGVLWAFALKRAIRILPLFWIVTTLLVILTWFVPDLGQTRSLTLSVLTENYALIAPDKDLYLGVAWTLKREFLFYTLLAIGLAVPRVGFKAFWAWQMLIVVMNIYDPQWSAGPRGDTFLGVYNLSFGVGALIAKSLARPLPLTLSQVSVAVGSVATIGLVVREWLIGAHTPHSLQVLGDVASPLMYLASCGLVVLGLVHLELRNPLPSSNAAGIFAGSSYALYLFHGLVISVLVRAIRPNFGISPEIVFIIVTIAALAAAVAIHIAVDRPILATLRLHLLAPRGPVVAAE